MQSMVLSARHSDGHLWMTALGLSLLVNCALVAAFGFAALEAELLRKKSKAEEPPPSETVAMIYPEMIQRDASSAAASIAPAPAPPPVSARKESTRTSEDQTASRPQKPAFIGERNTQATSDRAPTPDAPPLPSQAGIDPRYPGEIETTQSRYQDGSLSGDPALAPKETPVAPAPEVTPAPDPVKPSETAARKPAEAPGTDEIKSTPPPPEKLLEGPNPVDVQVPREVTKQDLPKPAPEKHPVPDQSSTLPETAAVSKPAELPKPKPIKDPAFKGYQRKTAVVGSITRSGRSALDVEDTPLGRYEAAVGRAVEQEWQRNCVRHRDFITPGFLTVRFYVEARGKVRSVQFVGDMETGEVQKGFTLNSIRDAEIPPMPPSMRKEYEKDPLELIFRFYF
jgi:hypothetical protein